MNFGSFCSGIGAPEVAWSRLGWHPQFFSEIEPFPCAVLAHHYPAVPNLGDMEKITREEIQARRADALVAGTPCQSFSVAGLRKGMADPRGNLALVFLRLVDWARPRWVVWENVDGVRSSGRGRDFGAFLGAMGQLGYGWAYRVLDAQYGGVPQRRRRVFVVGHLGDWRRAAAVLFERQSLCGYLPPCRETGSGIAPTIAARPSGGGGLGTDFEAGGGLIPFDTTQITSEGNYSSPKPGDPCHPLASVAHPPAICHTLRAEGFDASEDGTGRGIPLIPSVAPTLTSNGDAHSGFRDERGLLPVAYGIDSDSLDRSGEGKNGTAAERAGLGVHANLSPTLRSKRPNAVAYRVHGEHSTAMTGDGVANVADPVDVARSLDTCGGYPTNQGGNIVQSATAVRRLTPLECERLMGFPDGYTAVPFRGKPVAADGPRYRALGNSMVVPELGWIAPRIMAVEAEGSGT